MLIEICKILSNLDNKIKLALAIGFASFSATIPITIALIFINAGRVSYKSDKTEIDFAGKTIKAANDTEYSTRELSIKLIKLQSEIAKLKTTAEQNPRAIPQQIKDVDNSFNELLPTARQTFEDTQELTNHVESAIDVR